MTMKSVLAALAIACAGDVLALPPRTYPGETNGCNPVPASENTWKACDMTAVGGKDVTDDDYVILPGEFFELEYGKPLEAFDYEDGLVKRWGRTRETPDEPGVMFPRGWGDYPMGHWAVVAEFEQNVEESEWVLQAKGRPFKFKLKAKPGERTRRFFNRGMFRLPGNTYGITLSCVSTNGVKGTMHALKFVAYSLPVEFRKTFTLDKAPSFAGASVRLDPFGEIIVNGQVVDRAVRVRTLDQMRRIDITKYLKTGENTVGYRMNGACGWSSECHFNGLMEFFTVDDEGRTTVYGSDKTWEGRISSRPWRPVGSANRPTGVTRTRGGFAYQDGQLPMHAGALRVTPHGEPHPVFDYDREIAYDLAWPKGVKDAIVKAVVTDAFTGKNVSTAAVQPSASNDLQPVSIRFCGLKTGAYDIAWTLLSGDRVVDSYSTEMVVAGPLDGKAYALDEIEGELAKRKRLIHTIHPADAQYDVCSSNYIGHTGLYTTGRPDCGRVIEECGVKMRETEGSDGAYFAWHVPVGTLGNAHIMEVDYSDAREQVIRAAVFETFPVNFCNNDMRSANANATGSVRTGGRAPLTGKVQTLRFVFFPGSRALQVSFESGLGGKPAACSEIRIYEVEGGLPAWDAPKSERVFMNHTERTLWGQWGAARHPSMGVGLFQDYRPRLWSAAFLATKNRLSQLKYEGHNAVVEGLYMYDHAYATRSGESKDVYEDMDLYRLIAKMYKHNGIKLFVGFEYSISPALWGKGFFDVSERDIWSGRKAAPFHIDRHGRTASLYWGSMGFDDTHPLVRQSMRNVVSEIYARYADCGVAGLYMVCGSGWLPGFVTPRGMDANEVGFEDEAIRRFEADAGVRLGTDGTDPKRFQKRFEILTGEKYAKRWADWRTKQVKESVALVRDVVTSGPEKWRLLMAGLMNYKLANPFIGLSSTPEERDAYQPRVLRDNGFDVDAYTGANADGVEFLPTFNYEREMGFADYGALVNDGSREMIRKADGLYYMPIGLNERGNLTQGIKTHWWWERTNSPVFDTKYANGAAYSDFVDLVDRYTPKTMVHTWLDCDIPTAFGADLRNFLKGYYETPAGDGMPYDGVKGATARIYGGKLQLVNNTPWTARSDELTLPPYAVRVVEKPHPMTFRFDADVEKDVFARLDAALANDEIVRRIRPDRLPKLRQAQATRDAYLAENTMRDWEVQSVLDRAASAAAGLPLQKRFEAMLAKDGVARINCGAAKDMTDAKGRLWLRDQPYTGFGTYGSEFTAGNFDRGDIEIFGAGDETDLCYRTEAGGYDALQYHVPVPEGTYTLKLHIASTWGKKDGPPGPACQVVVNGRHQVIDPWGEPNPFTFGAHTGIWKGLKPNANGELAISITRCPILNGVEVIRE